MQSRTGATNSHILSDESAFSSKKTNGFATIPICSSSSPSCVSFIEHRVSRLDTLAGVAINYGVEVADIKRVNGLVTDIQMFAHKSLQIPLPGKHPPSPVISNGLARNRASPPPLTSPAMRTLQNFYGLNPKPNKLRSETLLTENPNHPSESQTTDPTFRPHRRSRSVANVTCIENGDRSMRTYQKALESVKKSLSASNLSESESASSAIRAARKKRGAVSGSVFYGLPKPVVGSKNKAALD